MAEEIAYRIPSAADAGALATLHVACWREAYRGIVPDSVLDGVNMADRVTAWQGYLSAEGCPTHLAEAGGEPAGFIRAGRLKEPLVQGADGHIFALYVLDRHYRKGIGRRLLGLAAADWLGQGGAALSVGVLSANGRARAFYEAMGARFAKADTYEWDGNVLDESLYIFENLEELARFA